MSRLVRMVYLLWDYTPDVGISVIVIRNHRKEHTDTVEVSR